MSVTQTNSDYLAIIRRGLPPRSERPQRVIVVGAGMAGLVAAYELLRAGHDPLILEARQRVGGRVHTLREPFSYGLHAEGGAMRIPGAHDLSMAYIEKWGLKTFPFTANNPKCYCYVRGKRHRIDQFGAKIEQLGFELSENERGKTPAQLWEAAIQPMIARIRQESHTAWPEVIAKYDGYSVREFAEAQGWSEDAIELLGLILNQESQMNVAFLELLREEVGDHYRDTVQIEGGMDRLPCAFLPDLRDRIHFGARMTAIDQDTTSVTVHYRTLLGDAHVTGDYALITLPFPVLRHIRVLKPFSVGKQRAIRQLHYDSATKVFLQCRRRFWEEDDDISGGVTVTDLPVRNIYYPEHGRDTGRGVLLASYTWSDEARQWGALPPANRIIRAAENVAEIHPQSAEEFEGGTSIVWDQDPFAGGAFALFYPDQETVLFEHIVAPEGRIHFAGEHTTRTHAWIQGAIESGLRAACEIHTRQSKDEPIATEN